MKSQRMWSGVVALGGLVLLLGCGTQTSAGDAGQAPAKSSPTSPNSPTSPGLTAASPKPTVTVPPGTGKPVKPGDFAPEVIWQRDQLIVTAFGSSTCRPTADEAVVADSHTIVVRFGERSKDQLCTDDYGPTRSRIPAPAGDIDLDSDVFATFELEGAPPQLIPVELVHPVLN